MGANDGKLTIADEDRGALGDEGRKRMGDVADVVYTGKPFVLGNGDEGKTLPVYFGEAGGSGRLSAGCGAGRSMIHQMGENIGRYSIGDITSRAADEGNTRYCFGGGTEGRLSAETTASGWPDGRHRGAGVEIAGTVHRAAEEVID